MDKIFAENNQVFLVKIFAFYTKFYDFRAVNS